VSVHGGDLLSPLLAGDEARREIGEVLAASAVAIANSSAMLRMAAGLAGSDERMRVIHPPGTPPPAGPVERRPDPTVATVAHAIPRKRHADVLEAIARARERVPGLRYVVIGNGPEHGTLRTAADRLGIGAAVEWTGALEPERAVAELARCHLMAMPSEDEAFGVAYAEALSCGVPAIGCAGEPGPEDIAGLGEAMLLVPPRDPGALADAIAGALADRARWRYLSAAARRTAEDHFTLERCGALTVAAYREAIG
jgi:teichuronic acid biosynthesis glycosyltransferase TuaC